MWLLYLPKDLPENRRKRIETWTPSVQDAEPQGGFYVIKQYDLKGTFSSRCRSQRETVAIVPFGSLTMVGSRIREGN